VAGEAGGVARPTAHELGLTVSLEESELAEARARIVLSSRAAGLEGPIDSPWFHFKEAEAFERALERSRRSGFQGRLCVHPDQIGPVNRGYMPTAEEITRAERIVAAFSEARRAARRRSGRRQMIDYPVAHQAQALLDSVRSSPRGARS
jgi:citrate lyase subunit beta/citryl-CoA lyase